MHVLHSLGHGGHLHGLGQGGVPFGRRGSLRRGRPRHAQRAEGRKRDRCRDMRVVPVESRRFHEDHTSLPYAVGEDQEDRDREARENDDIN